MRIVLSVGRMSNVLVEEKKNGLKLAVFIAKRYLISKKSFNIINIISVISLTGVVVGTMALIVILSVFNGFEDLVGSLYSKFDPAIRITPKEGKVFEPSTFPAGEIRKLPDVVSCSEVLEGNVLLRYQGEQYIATLKGESPDFLDDNPLQSNIVSGDFRFDREGAEALLLGYFIAYKLDVSLKDIDNRIQVFSPARFSKNYADLQSAFVRRAILPGGVFSIQQDIDAKYVISSLRFAREIFQYESKVSALEIRLDSLADMEALQSQVERMLPPGKFKVKNRYQQQEVLYKVMRTEKWFLFLILIFILIIAIFNLVSSLTMMILDKIKDLSLLYGMGMSLKTIRKIFISAAMMIVFAGEIAGLSLGAFLCYLQQEFGLVRLGGEVNAFLVAYYPVQFHWTDFALSILSVSLIGFLAALIPVMRLKDRFLQEQILKNIRGH